MVSIEKISFVEIGTFIEIQISGSSMCAKFANGFTHVFYVIIIYIVAISVPIRLCVYD